MDFSDDQPRGHENLRLTIVRPVLEMRVVYFYFRPELSIKVILKGIVPRICAANLGFVARRQGHAQSPLNVESSEPLPIGDGRRDDRIGCSILVLTCGQSRLK